MDFVASLTIFVLAIFVGFEIITKVPPTLHTPLMSGSNAISGIAIVGGIVALADQGNDLIKYVAFAGLVFASINVFGGYAVTDRMLKMFRKR